LFVIYLSSKTINLYWIEFVTDSPEEHTCVYYKTTCTQYIEINNLQTNNVYSNWKKKKIEMGSVANCEKKTRKSEKKIQP
jgi:hypothetical protein